MTSTYDPYATVHVVASAVNLKLGAKDIRSLLESKSIVALAKATVFPDIEGVIPTPG